MKKLREEFNIYDLLTAIFWIIVLAVIFLPFSWLSVVISVTGYALGMYSAKLSRERDKQKFRGKFK